MFEQQFTLIILISHQILYAVHLRFAFVNCTEINYEALANGAASSTPEVCVEAAFDE